MKLTRNKKIVLPALIILTLVCSSLSASAASTKKMLEAYYGVKIQYNGQNLTSTNQPFIVNGATYVPLRMIMDNFGDKSVQWNSQTQTVVINNSTSNMESVYMQQIVARNKEIEELKAELAKLKTDNVNSKDEFDLDALEEDLVDDYEDYKRKDFDFSLSGDNEEIKLTVKVDKDDWNDIDQDDREDLLDDICDDIWDEVDDADIEGKIKDGSKTLEEFSVKAGRDVKLEDLDDKLDDLAEVIEDDRDRDWDRKDLPLDLKIDGDEDDNDIEFTIKIDLGKKESDWKDLSDSDLEDLMKDIYDDIEDEYDEDDYDIKGAVYDTDTKKDAATYDKDDFKRIID